MVVIGSGATAITIVPAMASQAEHVTMLQRSPTYVMSLPEEDRIALGLARVLPARTAYALTRRKNVWLQRNLYRLSQTRPGLMRWLLRWGASRQLPDGYPVDLHFNPTYKPWDQRLCIVPDGDLFAALRGGRASIVTDRIACFTEHGVKLASGRSYRRTSSSSPPALSCSRSGGSNWPSTANRSSSPRRSCTAARC